MMAICTAELQNVYKDRRTPESLESLVEHLLSCGVKPTEITIDRISKIFGYESASGLDTLTKEYEGLTQLTISKIQYYNPRVSFDMLMEKFLVGQSRSHVDKVYGLIKEHPGIPLGRIMKKLGLSDEGVRHSGETLSDIGLVVPVREYNKDTKHSFLRYFLTEYSGMISPDDLKIFKSIRGKRTFEYLVALYLFDELSTIDLSKSFGKTSRDVYSCFSRLVERGTVEKFGSLDLKTYRLNKLTYNAISHLFSFLRKVDEKKTEEFMDSIRYKVERQKLYGKRVIIKKEFFKKIVSEVKGADSLRELSFKLKMPCSTLKGYIYTTKSIPFEVLDRLFTSQSRIKWKEVEKNIQIKTYSPSTHLRLQNVVAILKKYGLSEVLERMQEKQLIGEKWRVIKEELKKLPTFEKLKMMKSGSINDIYISLNKRKNLVEILHELKILTEVGLIKKEFDKYKIIKT
jgi:hypothetical protein